MPNVDVFIALFATIVTVYLATPRLIRYLRKIGILVKDQNKKEKPLVPLSGGLAVMSGLFIGIATFIFLRTFITTDANALVLSTTSLALFFVALTTIILISFVGFIDDIMIRKDKETSEGLQQWQKPLLTLVAAIPLMVINAGTSHFWTPLGQVEVGFLYPLLIIPVGVVGAANMVNMLAGYNGLEAGMGTIITGMLGIYAYVNERYVAALIGLLAAGALATFYYYNKFPAKILPGDSLTYLVGATIACIAIIGNIEKAALIASIPFFIEFVLKARKRFNVDSFGQEKDGKIISKYDKIYSIPHIFAKTGKFTEAQITYACMAIVLISSSLMWVL